MINISYCIKQYDSKYCKCACLTTICKTYGLKYQISKIREVARIDKIGTSALGIIQASEKLGISAKGVKANKPQDIFGEILLPAIVHVVIDKSLLVFHY